MQPFALVRTMDGTRGEPLLLGFCTLHVYSTCHSFERRTHEMRILDFLLRGRHMHNWTV
jgi:hypothetical protein